MVDILNGGNGGKDFRIRRMPEAESPGYPYLYQLSLDGHVIASHVTKTGLNLMKREINQALKTKETSQ